MRDLQLGRYIPIHSWYHQLDVRAKAIVMILSFIMIGCASTYESLGLCFFVFLVLWISSRLSPKLWLRQVLLLKWLYLVLILISPSDGLFQSLKIMLFGLVGALYTFTTTPTQTSSLFPSQALIGFQLSLSLRLVPLIFEEVKKVYAAQVSRGLDFSTLTFRQMMRQLVAIIIPAISATMNRLVALCDALECRGFVIGEKRSRVYQRHFGRREFFVICFVCFHLILVLS